MSKIRKRDELDCEEMKPFCPLISPVYDSPFGPVMCEGRFCDVAYQRWYAKHATECVSCGEVVDIDTCETFNDEQSGYTDYYVCETCLDGKKR